MEQIKCPLCKGGCIMVVDRTAWFGTTAPVIAYHPAPPGSARHPASNLCLASGCPVEFAESIAADRRAGVHLLPHP